MEYNYKRGNSPTTKSSVVIASSLDELEEMANSINQEFDYDDGMIDDESPQIAKTKYDNWAVHGGTYVANATPNVTIGSLPAGKYTIKHDDNYGIIFRKSETNTDELLNLPFKEYDGILEDIDKFWQQKEKYKEYNYIHKRGILLHGPAGSGKSSLVHLITDNVIEQYNGLVFYIANDYELELTAEAFHQILSELEPDRPKIVIVEDVDNFTRGKAIESRLLGLIDGNATMTNTLTIATTNYPEELPDRIKNRPNRFDTIRQIGFPDESVRRYYLTHKIHDEDAHLVDMDEWVEKTENFTIAHIKELITSVIVIGKTFQESIDNLNELRDSNISSRDYEQRKAGFRR